MEKATAIVHNIKEVKLQYPFWRYAELFTASEHVFLLDSAKKSGQLGLHSYIGADPFLVFKAKRVGNSPSLGANIEQTTFKSSNGKLFTAPQVNRYKSDPITSLQSLLKKYAPERDVFKESPFGLHAGAVGYVGYEAGYYVEELPDVGEDDLNLPDIYLGFYDLVLCYDHQEDKAYVSVIGRGPDAKLANGNAQEILEQTRNKLVAFEAGYLAPVEEEFTLDTLLELEVIETTKAQYYQKIKTCLEHIQRGDAYEICLTHRMECKYSGDGWQLYQQLRAVNPAPFSCYLRFPGAEVISSSPERFLKLDSEQHVSCRPIKGTRSRGNTAIEDQQQLASLEHSLKDRAENIMIVDLVRNDLGKVCDIGSIHVPELLKIEQYATVFQLVSAVEGTLKNGLDAFDLLRATFPGGSMTGAPKIEAMKIIDRLEPVKRGIYSGGIGYIDFSGSMDLNIVIRTIVLKEDTCYFNVGGAIVADSIPEEEYKETLAKAAALIEAIQRATALT